MVVLSETYMQIETARYRLRDFVETDRPAFLCYQMDERYRRLYDFQADDLARANELFNLFVSWQADTKRENFQLGIFELKTGRLCGSAGLRRSGHSEGKATLGIELTPDDWGRYRLALEVVHAIGDFGFCEMELSQIIADTASGNTRVAKIARHFGARLVDERDGPEWMKLRGWHEVDWAVDRAVWASHRKLTTSGSAARLSTDAKPRSSRL
jgi:[ribosomal protein S5]-alanine N-acetyltransferase